MATEYNEQNDKKGKKLASGHGMAKMLDVCYKNGWSDDNTILVVSNTGSFDSRWTIYERVKVTEEE